MRLAKTDSTERPEPPISTADGLCCDDGSWLLALIGERWCVPVLRHLACGAMRYNALARSIPGISMRMLSRTLMQLTRDGLVHKTVHPVQPPRTEYALSDLGRSLMGPLLGLTHWAQHHRDAVVNHRAQQTRRRLELQEGLGARRIVRFTPRGVRQEAVLD